MVHQLLTHASAMLSYSHKRIGQVWIEDRKEARIESGIDCLGRSVRDSAGDIEIKMAAHAQESVVSAVHFISDWEVQIPENGKYPSGLILSGSDGDGLVAADIDLGGIQDSNTDGSRTSGENKDDCDGQNHKNAFCFFHDNLVCLIAFHCQYMGCIEKTQLTSAGCDSIL